MLVRVPVEVVKDWNIKAEDQIETDISWVGSDAVSYTHLDVYKRQVEGLLDKFKVGAGKKLDNDRILLSNE